MEVTTGRRIRGKILVRHSSLATPLRAWRNNAPASRVPTAWYSRKSDADLVITAMHRRTISCVSIYVATPCQGKSVKAPYFAPVRLLLQQTHVASTQLGTRAEPSLGSMQTTTMACTPNKGHVPTKSGIMQLDMHIHHSTSLFPQLCQSCRHTIVELFIWSHRGLCALGAQALVVVLARCHALFFRGS